MPLKTKNKTNRVHCLVIPSTHQSFQNRKGSEIYPNELQVSSTVPPTLCSREATRIEITSARKASETDASSFQSSTPTNSDRGLYDRIEVEIRTTQETRIIPNAEGGEPRRTSEASVGAGQYGAARPGDAC